MREKPYQVINLTNGLTVEWCTYGEYIARWSDKPGFDVNYRPGRKKKVKK